MTSPSPGPGPIVWIASYPKSGNTWLRAILTAVSRGDHLFALDRLGSGAQPAHVASALVDLGLDPRWLSPDQIELVRTALITRQGAGPAPMFRKTHEVYRHRPLRWSGPLTAAPEPFPSRATRGAILVVRDPRDVVCSYAAFFGIPLAEAVAALRTEAARPAAPAAMLGEEPWGSWSSNASSWLGEDVPFPVWTVRYEDLRADAVTSLLPVLAGVGLDVERDDLSAAVDRARWGRLREEEDRAGFAESSPWAARFFRRGTSGGWREELPAELVAQVERDHGPMMERMGYALSARTRRDPVAATGPIRTRLGPVPHELVGAVQPQPWAWVEPGRVLVRFPGGQRLLVTRGDEALIDPGADEPPVDSEVPSDLAWIAQGWAVMLAHLQRGGVSLHAASVEVGTKVVCIAGNRRSGKSTAAMGAHTRGHRILVDDVSPLDLGYEGAGGPVLVLPFPRQVHLTSESAQELGIDFDALVPLGGGRLKAGFRPADPGPVARPVDVIAVLAADPDVDDVTVRPLEGADRVAALRPHTVHRGLSPAILGPDRYFRLLTDLANRVRVVEVQRPAGRWSTGHVIDAVEGLVS